MNVLSPVLVGDVSWQRRLIVELVDRGVDETAELLQFTESEFSLPLEECRLRDRLRALLFDPFEEGLPAARKLDADSFGTTVRLLDGFVRLGLGLLAQVCGVLLSGLAKRVGAVPGILEDALDLLTDRVESWHLLDAVGGFEGCDPTMQLPKLPDRSGQLSLGLRRVGSRDLDASLLVRDVGVDLLGVVTATI